MRDSYLTVCAIFRDEAPYLREWLEFHLLAGVERFVLYDNMSIDHPEQVLAPYLADGVVSVRAWPRFPGQNEAYEDCLRHGPQPRWTAFIDIDEFLFSPTGQPLPQVLTDYECWPGVAVNWAYYGPSGHVTRPPGLTIEHYTGRVRTHDGWNHWVKSIVDPLRAIRSRTHVFAFDRGSAVDEAGVPIARAHRETVSYEKLRINHYGTRSHQEWSGKLRRPMAHNGALRKLPCSDLVTEGLRLSEVHDACLLPHVPAVQAALAARRALH